MSFDDALLYLKARAGTVDFVHCVARHHVDDRARTNMYDLVMLEKPGHPQSDGLIFRRGDRSDRQKQGRFPGRLMQVSLKGVVMGGGEGAVEDGFGPSPSPGGREKQAAAPTSASGEGGGGGGGVFVPLELFVHERDLCFRLLQMKFFSHFKQYKCFSAWKLSVRRGVFERRRARLLAETLFADAPLVGLVAEVYAAAFALQQQTDLFEYFGSGLVNTRSYVHAQEQKFYVEFAKIKTVILGIGELIEGRYAFVCSAACMGAKVDALTRHHPYSKSASSGAATPGTGMGTGMGGRASPLPGAAPEAPVDWDRVRSVQLLKAEYRGKVERVIKCAEFMTENVIGNILHRFWARLTKSVLGVTIVNRDKARAIVGYWAQSAQEQPAAPAPAPAAAPAAAEKAGAGAGQGSEVRANRRALDDSSSRKGRYLTVYSAFFIDNRPFDPDMHVSRSISKMKIAVDPSSAQVMHYLHDMYGVLGILLSHLPKLRYHPVVYLQAAKVDIFNDPPASRDGRLSPRSAEAAPAPAPAAGLKKQGPWLRGRQAAPSPAEEAAAVARVRGAANYSGGSSVLFVYLQNCEILAQMGTQQTSVRVLHQVSGAEPLG
jgi:hypothetical protein